MNDQYRIVEDSVGGTRCLIVYEGQKPVCTIWEEINSPVNLHGTSEQVRADIASLVSTCRGLGGGFPAISAALVEYFRSQ